MSEMPDVTEILTVAIDAARAAGRFLRETWTSRTFAVTHQEHHDVKLVADAESERLIGEFVRARRPDDGVLGEEGGVQEYSAGGMWVVDPLDGTVNFSHGHPHFCVSIAWAWQREVMAGVIYDPVREELFSAVRGRGAQCNGTPISVAGTQELRAAIVTVGFGKHQPERKAQREFAALSAQAQKVRVSGSAGLDLAYVACGRLDAYFESQIYVWDVAAGGLIVAEAGGTALLWRGRERFQRGCVAGTPRIAAALAELFELDVNGCARTCFDEHGG